MSVTVRAATEHDIAGIVACLAAAFEPYRDRYTAGAFADTVPDARGVRERLDAMRVFVADAGTGVVTGTIACLAVGGGEGHLRGMAVLPELASRGIADALLGAAEEELRRRGCTRVTLDTTAPLQRAIRFYARQGFRPTGRVSDFFGMSLYEYEKPLT
jgi:ribosomal protein S18 acetylase RimI-like enzyme